MMLYQETEDIEKLKWLATHQEALLLNEYKSIIGRLDAFVLKAICEVVYFA